MAGQDQQKKTRASAPKKRTGCITCKIRRVKCDETRPICLRCEKGKYQCDGYEACPPRRRRNKTKMLEPSTTSSLPDLSSSSYSSVHEDMLIGPPTGPQLPRGLALVDLDNLDAFYFNFFRFHVSNQIAGYDHSQFWSRGVLRDSIADDCIRHNVLGISALFSARYLSSQDSRHHNAALGHYGKALTLFRERMNAAGHHPDPSLVLPATVLFLVFHLFLGDFSAFNNLLSTTLKLYRNRFKLLQSSPIPSQEASELSELEDLLHHMSVFTGLRPMIPFKQSHRVLLDSRPTQIPPQTADLPTVTRSWRSMYSRSMTLGTRVHEAWLGEATVDLALMMQEQVNQAEELTRWRAFFDQRLTNLDERYNMEALHIQCLACFITNSGCMDPTSRAYDDMLDDFVELCERGEKFLRKELDGMKLGFTCNMGMVSSVCMVAGLCRDRELRLKALEVIETLPARWMAWKEGLWNQSLVTKGVRTLVELEEAGRDPLTGFLWPNARYKWDGLEKGESGKPFGIYVGVMPNDDGTRRRLRIEL